MNPSSQSKKTANGSQKPGTTQKTPQKTPAKPTPSQPFVSNTPSAVGSRPLNSIPPASHQSLAGSTGSLGQGVSKQTGTTSSGQGMTRQTTVTTSLGQGTARQTGTTGSLGQTSSGQTGSLGKTLNKQSVPQNQTLPSRTSTLQTTSSRPLKNPEQPLFSNSFSSGMSPVYHTNFEKQTWSELSKPSISAEDNHNKAPSISTEDNRNKAPSISAEDNRNKVSSISTENNHNKVSSISTENNHNKAPSISTEDNHNKTSSISSEDSCNKESSTIPVRRWFVTFMCMNIPIIGWIYLIVLAFSRSKGARRDFAKAYLLYKLVFLLISAAILAVAIHYGLELLDLLLSYMDML